MDVLQEAVLLHVCGSNEADTVRGILNAIATKAVWGKCSLAGQTGKKPLKNSPIYRVIQSK